MEIDEVSVLIVDDSDDVREFLRLLFSVEGFQVVGDSKDAEEATTAAAQLEPDLIVLDYLMPSVNGDEAASMLRSVAPKSKILGFSAVLGSTPDWADVFVPKERIGEVLRVAEALMTK